ncbi:hypothetical protein COV12_01785 [Candidatus Woesearchaeota archaeon CG10_big_fil_rev_8_21_14_0_10_32_24]|nr:MAG: hypothetical protein COV12_01785 [Candidatus Woesearchaeota archaeon CG10_big_fil_rev_8_21_14_0_10_32_24]
MPIQAMTQLAETILDVIDWGIAIVTILILWELFMTFSGKKDTTFDFEKNKLMTWGAFNKEGKRLDRTKMVNEYLAEEKEEKLLEGTVGYVDSVVVTLESWDVNKEIPDHNGLVKLRGQVKNAGSEMHAAERYFRTLKRDTWRNDAKLNHVLDDLEKFNKGDVEEIRALENTIMKLHEETAVEVKKSEAVLQTLLKTGDWTALSKLKQTNFTAGGKFKINPAGGKSSPTRFNQTHVTNLIKGFKNDAFLLKTAFAKQTAVKKEMQGLLAKTREYYK